MSHNCDPIIFENKGIFFKYLPPKNGGDLYRQYRYNCISLDDKCQFWLDENTKVLTSPYYDGYDQRYYNNLNCTWMLKAEEGSYVNLEIEYSRVNDDT